MGCAEYVQLVINNVTNSKTLMTKNTTLQWGKFYVYPNKDKEIQPSAVNGTQVEPQAGASIASCGRKDSASDTQGHINLYDGNTKVFRLNWDDLWQNGATNTFSITNYLPNSWIASNSTFNSIGPDLGTITVKVVYFG